MRALALLAVALLVHAHSSCAASVLMQDPAAPAADVTELTLMEPEATDINGETVGLVLSDGPAT
jgi:hypothetical protein